MARQSEEAHLSAKAEIQRREQEEEREKFRREMELRKKAEHLKQIKQLLDKPVGVFSRYSNMDYVHNEIGWKATISVKEGMRRVLEQQKKNQGIS